MDEKLLKLNTLLQAIKKDVVTPRDIEGFVAVFLEEVKKTKDSLEIVTNDKVAYLEEVLKHFEEKRADLLEGIDSSIEEREKYLNNEFGNTIDTLKASVSSEITPLRDVLSESIKESQAIIKQLKNVKIKQGVDGKDADETLIVERVLEKIVLPEYKETVLDGGEEIVDKINALPTEPEFQIDASHIKNLPQIKGVGGSTARNLYQLGDVSLSSPSNDDVLKYNSTTGLWENGVGGSSDSFETVSKNLQSYDYTINYNGSGDVSSIVYSAGITKTFNYTSGDITSIVLSGSTPSGIDLTKSLTYDLDGNVEEITYS